MSKIVVRKIAYAPDNLVNTNKYNAEFSYSTKIGNGKIDVYCPDGSEFKVVVDPTLKYGMMVVGEATVKISKALKMSYHVIKNQQLLFGGHIKGDDFLAYYDDNDRHAIVLVNPPEKYMFAKSNDDTITTTVQKINGEVVHVISIPESINSTKVEIIDGICANMYWTCSLTRDIPVDKAKPVEIIPAAVVSSTGDVYIDPSTGIPVGDLDDYSKVYWTVDDTGKIGVSGDATVEKKTATATTPAVSTEPQEKDYSYVGFDDEHVIYGDIREVLKSISVDPDYCGDEDHSWTATY